MTRTNEPHTVTGAPSGQVVSTSSPTRARRLVFSATVFAVVTLGGFGALAASSSRALADVGRERVVSFDADITLQPDGTMRVVETITYDFADTNRHGIYRYVPDHFACEQVGIDDVCKKGFDRVTPITVTSVTADPGAPADRKLTHQGRALVIRIGDPNRLVSGRHTYAIAYTVNGAFSARNGLAPLAWNVTGEGWQVPIDDVVVHLHGPVAFTDVRCAAGPHGSIPCRDDKVAGADGTLGVAQLAAGQGLAFDASLPTSAVAIAPVEVERRFSFAYAFSPTAPALGGAAAMLVTGAAAVWAMARRGRDRVFAGVGADVALGRVGNQEQALGLRQRAPSVVEFAPPAGVRPGELGALIDEKVQSRDIAATIVDLAIRGHLTIAEVAGSGLRAKTDHELTKLAPTADRADGATLAPYESELLTRLFKSGSLVRLSALARKFASDNAAVSKLLYIDLVERGWYTKRPDQQRARGTALGIVVIALGVFLTIAFANAGPYGLATIPIVLAGVALIVVGRKLAVRTAAGTAIAGRCRGFAQFIESPTQAAMAQFAEREDLFIQYLPFAVALGATSGWAHAFAELGQLPPPMLWYVPLAGSGGGHDPWGSIADHVTSFSSSAATTLTSSSSSGGSGGGGGGFGGGGGGSW